MIYDSGVEAGMENGYMDNIGQIVKLTRQKLGMTQAELGQKIDRPQSSIARFESGNLGDTHFGFIVDIAQALSLRPEELVAMAFGRELRREETHQITRDEILERIKAQLQNTDPRTTKLLGELFSHLSSWFKDVPEVPELKK